MHLSVNIVNIAWYLAFYISTYLSILGLGYVKLADMSIDTYNWNLDQQILTIFFVSWNYLEILFQLSK